MFKGGKMYIEIKENKLLSWCESPYLYYEFVELDYATFDSSKYEVQNGQLVDISDTDNYKAKVAQQQKEIKLANLKLQVEELDQKRIRSIAEPTQKDANQTWLEYYTQQIQDLRQQIQEV